MRALAFCLAAFTCALKSKSFYGMTCELLFKAYGLLLPPPEMSDVDTKAWRILVDFSVFFGVSKTGALPSGPTIELLGMT